MGPTRRREKLPLALGLAFECIYWGVCYWLVSLWPAINTIVVILLIAMVVRWAIVSQRRYLRERRFREYEYQGLCPYCGYDLRATPSRCPECGRRPESHPMRRKG